MEEEAFKQEQIKKLKTSFLVWIGVFAYLLIVGIVMCFVGYGILMLAMIVVNLIFALKVSKFRKRIESGEADVKEIYSFYESLYRRDKAFIVVNLLCGGLFGVIGTMYEMSVVSKGLLGAEKILGESFKEERAAADPNAQWHYCIYCKRNRREGYSLIKLSDGVICAECEKKYKSMLPKRLSDPMNVKDNDTVLCCRDEDAIRELKLSSKDLEDRLAHLNENKARYANFTPTKTICDGALELDEANLLFRVVEVPRNVYNSARVGCPSGLVYPYSAVKGVCYEKIYEYEDGSDDSFGRWRYTDYNSIVLAVDDPYLNAEVFTLDKIPTKFFSSTSKPQIEHAEQTVKELEKLFGKPALPPRKVRR